MYKLLLLLLTIGLLPIYGATLVGYWDFEEGSGTTAKDRTGNGLNGTISNAAYTAGRVGSYALNFNGSNSFVEVLNSALLVPSTISISLWFKASSSQVTHADLLDKGHGSGSTPYYGGYVFQYDGDGSSISTIYGNGSNFYGASTGMNDKDNQWHHLVAVLGASEISVYQDGFLISKTAGAGPLVQNDANLYFGRHRTVGRYFNGALDDIRIYSGALTQTEVSTLATGAIPEPSSLCLIGLALFGLMTCRKLRG